MPLYEKVLVNGEQIASIISYGGVKIVVTNRVLLVESDSTVVAVPPRHVYALVLSRSLALFAAGLLLIILGASLPIIHDYFLDGFMEDVVGYASTLLLAAGLTLAIYGWLRRYTMSVHHAAGEVSVKGGGNVVEAFRRLREIVEEGK